MRGLWRHYKKTKMKRTYSFSLGVMKAHVTYKVKYCHRIFMFPAIKARCEEIFLEVSERYDFEIEEMGFDEDLLHLTISPFDISSSILSGL